MIDQDAIAKVQRSQRARASVQRGTAGEAILSARLRAAGFLMVERIQTGFVHRGGRWVPGARVAGDFRAIAPGGISVMVESKMRDERLTWSDLERHQVAALDEHHRCGGLSFLGWIHLPEVDLLRWPVAGFGPGESITAADIIDRALRYRP